MALGIEGRQKGPVGSRLGVVALGPQAASAWPRTRPHSASGNVGFIRMSAARSRLAAQSAFKHLNQTYVPSQPQVALIVAPIDSAASAICSAEREVGAFIEHGHRQLSQPGLARAAEPRSARRSRSLRPRSASLSGERPRAASRLPAR